LFFFFFVVVVFLFDEKLDIDPFMVFKQISYVTKENVFVIIDVVPFI